MKIFKHLPILFASFALGAALASCSKDDNVPEAPVDPVNPSGSAVTLTQFDVILGDQTTSGTVSNRADADIDVFNNPKTNFTAGDYFTFQYANALQTTQKAYAYTSNGKTWTIHETEDANSQIKTIQLDSKSPSLSATFLSKVAVSEGADKDGILSKNGTAGKILVGCFDALRATAAVTINGNKATAKLPFQHVNHLLNFYINGTTNQELIDRLELNVTYTNAAGVKQDAILSTSSRASYADTEGKAHTVIQAIVPRDGVVKGIQVIKNDNALITTTDPINIECPSGKSHLVTLNANDNKMSVQVGSLTEGWAFSGELNPDGSPVGDIYIGTADELRGLANAVNINPTMPAAKINGVVAYTAHVVQTANIDLSSLPWRPIGGASYDDEEGFPKTTYFAGTFNGNGFKITGMKMPNSTYATSNGITYHAGLFGKVESPEGDYAILTNIQLENVNIQLNEAIQYTKVGALVGHAYAVNGKKEIIISQCSAQGTITVNNNNGQIAAGGLVGGMGRTHITGSTTNVSIVANAGGNSYTGGMAGEAENSSIVNCFAQNTVTGQSNTATAYSGGIIGSLYETYTYSYVIACRSDGNVAANGNKGLAGGIVGNNSGNIAGSYAKGNATSTSSNANIGAIVGGGNRVDLSYGAGAVGVGSSNRGAIPNSIVYNTNPAAGDILSIVSGKAWKDSHNGLEMAEATTGGILTVFAINTGGKQVLEVKPRLWVLFDSGVWSTSSPGSTTYPIPDKNYKGQ